MFGLQLHQSVHDPLPADLRVALRQLRHQADEAAHGAVVLRHKRRLRCGRDADHLPAPGAGAERRLSDRLERGQRNVSLKSIYSCLLFQDYIKNVGIHPVNIRIGQYLTCYFRKVCN